MGDVSLYIAFIWHLIVRLLIEMDSNANMKTKQKTWIVKMKTLKGKLSKNNP